MKMKIRDSYLWLKIKSSFDKNQLLTLALVPVLVAEIFYIGSFNLARSSSRSFLSTLVTAQVSLLSIVFALLILGFNLISDKYGVRVNQLIRKNPLFWLTGTLFLISVSLNLISLLSINQTLGKSWMFLLGASIGMTADSIVLLFVFVNSALKQTQPREILELIDQDNQPKMVMAKIRDREDKINNSNSAHPFYPVHRMALNSLERGDLATGQLAVRKMRDLAKNTIKELEDSDNFPDEHSDTAKQFIKPLTEDFFPQIAYEYVNEDYEVSNESIEAIRIIGEEVSTIQTGSLTHQSNYGFDSIIRDGLRREDSQKLVNKAMREKVRLVDYRINEVGFDSENESEIRVVETLVSQLDMLKKYPDREHSREYSPSYLEFFSTYPDIVEGALSEIKHESAKSDFRWYDWRKTTYDNGKIDPYLDLVESTLTVARNSIGEVTLYRIQTGSYPVAEGNYYDSLEKLASLPEDVSFENRRAFQILVIEATAQYYQKIGDDFNHLFIKMRKAGEEDTNIIEKSFTDVIEKSENGTTLFFFNHRYNNLSREAEPDHRYYFTKKNIFRSNLDKLKLSQLFPSGKTYYIEWLKGFKSAIEEEIDNKNS